MKIINLLKSEKLSLSFEVFPPKTDSAFDSVKTATEEIAKLKPSFMSVTYGAGGGTSKYTLDIAKNIKQMYGVPTLAHLTCVSSTKETVLERIEDIKNSGVKNIMALRGDLTPELENSDRSLWHYRNAVDLVRELKPIKIHAFPFSPRPDTVAATMKNQINRTVSKQRVKIINDAANENRANFMRAQVGKTVQVLVEENNIARCPHDIPVKISEQNIPARTICNVILTGVKNDIFIGKIA